MDTPLRLKAKERDSLTSKLNVCLIQVAFLQSILFSFPCSILKLRGTDFERVGQRNFGS